MLPSAPRFFPRNSGCGLVGTVRLAWPVAAAVDAASRTDDHRDQKQTPADGRANDGAGGEGPRPAGAVAGSVGLHGGGARSLCGSGRARSVCGDGRIRQLESVPTGNQTVQRCDVCNWHIVERVTVAGGPMCFFFQVKRKSDGVRAMFSSSRSILCTYMVGRCCGEMKWKVQHPMGACYDRGTSRFFLKLLT